MKGTLRMKFSKLSYREPDPKTLTSIIINIYLVIIFTVFPFYMKEGYVNLGNHKFYFFLYASLICVLLLLVSGIIPFIKEFSKDKIAGNPFKTTDIFVILFAIITIISYAFSDYRYEAFLGTDGWYMGFMTIMLMLSLYILISKLWLFNYTVLVLPLIASFVAFLLGLLDRFSVYIIPLEIRNPSFISTIGNINWFMGYYSVFVPIGIGAYLFLKPQKHEKLVSYFLTVYVIISFIAGFAQGSESVLLFDVALFMGLLFIIRKMDTGYEAWFKLLGLWGMSLLIFRIMKYLFKGLYNYDSQGALSLFTDNGTIAVFVILMSLTGYTTFKNGVSERKSRIFYRIIMSLPAAVLILWFVLAILRTKGIILTNIDSSVLILNQDFGHGRGRAYISAFDAIGYMNFKELIIGAGPDCFSSFLYSFSDVGACLKSYWPNDILTNAHNELLTMLVNEGFLGMITYGGIYVSFIVTGIRRSTKPFLMTVILMVFTYLIHNMISFSQIMNTPYIFIWMGIGAAYLKSPEFSSKIE